MQHAIIIFLLVCQFAIFAGIFWAEVIEASMIGPAEYGLASLHI